jgi:hypothetical protein
VVNSRAAITGAGTLSICCDSDVSWPALTPVTNTQHKNDNRRERIGHQNTGSLINVGLGKDAAFSGNLMQLHTVRLSRFTSTAHPVSGHVLLHEGSSGLSPAR